MEQERQLADQTFYARPGELKNVRKLVRRTLDSAGCKASFIERMALAVSEASMNIIQHGYALDGSKQFRVQILKDDDRLILRLTDNAPKIDENKIQPRDLDKLQPGGLGFHFISEIMDTVEFLAPTSAPGNVLQMTKKIE